ncbi:MAG: hypothetical protein WCI29_12650 [Actinomycetes bacterium]
MPISTSPALSGPRRRTASGLLAVVIATSAGLTACGGQQAVVAPPTPLALENTWRAGLFVTGYGPQGLGPVVASTAIPSIAASPDPSANPTVGSAPSGADQEVLGALGMVESDFATGYKVQLIDNGDSLSSPTLDFCNATYPSETQRTARRQVVLIDPTAAPMGVMTEAVMYETPAAAELALTELRAAELTCDPQAPVTFGTHSVHVTQRPTDTLDASGLTSPAHRLTIAVTLTDIDSGAVAEVLSVWQVQGRVLVALYFNHGGGNSFTAADLTNFHALAATLSGRLLALPTNVTHAS